MQPIIGDVYQFEVVGLASNQRVLAVLHYRVLDVVAGGNLLQMLTEISQMWSTYALPFLHESLFIQEYRLRHISGTSTDTAGNNRFDFDNLTVVPGIPGQDNGKVIGDALSTFTTASFRKITGNPSRSFRGGIRMSPITEADTLPEGNILAELFIQSTFDFAANVLYVEFNNGQDIVKSQLVVASTTDDGALRPWDPATSAADVVQLALSSFVSTQRTRKINPGQ